MEIFVEIFKVYNFFLNIRLFLGNKNKRVFTVKSTKQQFEKIISKCEPQHRLLI